MDARSRPVLVVDPYESARNALADLLRESGFPTVEASTGLEGILLVRQLRPALLIVDLWPFFSGCLHLVEWLRANVATRQVPILVVSSSLSPEYRRRALEAGCEMFLEKPCSPDEVLSEVCRILRRPLAVAVGSPVQL